MYTKDHLEALKLHGWDKFNVEILDGDNELAIGIYIVLMIALLFLVLKTDILFDHHKKNKN